MFTLVNFLRMVISVFIFSELELYPCTKVFLTSHQKSATVAVSENDVQAFPDPDWKKNSIYFNVNIQPSLKLYRMQANVSTSLRVLTKCWTVVWDNSQCLRTKKSMFLGQTVDYYVDFEEIAVILTKYLFIIKFGSEIAHF